jgi:ABC-type transporter Mla MlaB component
MRATRAGGAAGQVRADLDAGAAVLVLEGRVGRGDTARLTGRLLALLEGNASGRVVCDVSGVAGPDLGTVEVLARLRLTARRAGRRLVLRGVTVALGELLLLAGLVDVLPTERPLRLEPRGEAEEGEEAGGVEEEGDAGDAVAGEVDQL